MAHQNLASSKAIKLEKYCQHPVTPATNVIEEPIGSVSVTNVR
ncbi:hypothetical protein [Dendronalium sp. ChiSLP03b]|nr:hypothetical protein [Dendronalium sp. ChiSLP03b]MDZ8209319.1 hypothetical protein [Dendronalium sp. ChiSLP03b]